MFVQRVGDPQLADEVKAETPAVVLYSCQLTLKVFIVRLETIRGSHLDGDKVIIVLLELIEVGDCERNNLVRILELWIDRGGREYN